MQAMWVVTQSPQACGPAREHHCTQAATHVGRQCPRQASRSGEKAPPPRRAKSPLQQARSDKNWTRLRFICAI